MFHFIYIFFRAGAIKWKKLPENDDAECLRDCFYTFLWRRARLLCVINFHHIRIKGTRARAWWMANFTHFYFTLDNNNTQKEEKTFDREERARAIPSPEKKMKKMCAACGWNGENSRNLFHFILMNPWNMAKKEKKTTQHTIFAETESIVRCWRSVSCNYISSSQSRHMRIVLCRFLTQRQFFTPRRRSRLCHADVSHKGEVFKFLFFFGCFSNNTRKPLFNSSSDDDDDEWKSD